MRLPLPKLVACLLVAAFLPACATSGESSSGGAANVITYEDIQEISVTTAHDVVDRLQPRWLRSRGRTSLEDPTGGMPVVYLGSSRFGGVDSLHEISSTDIEEIRYFSASQATTRFGTGHDGGVIQVTLRR